MRKQPRLVINQNLYQKAVMAIPFAYGLTFVSVMEKTAIFFYENDSRGREVLINFLGDAELKSIMSDGYNAYVFIGDELKLAQFKDTIYQVCMSHANNKFVKVGN